MEWEKLTNRDYAVTEWSGGTTTQLAISPRGAAYGDRDFLWRLSSAKTEIAHTDFTPLPDYDRIISLLDGGLALKIGDGEKFPLPRFALLAFDGGVHVESWGICSDFNLMLRKGRCLGLVQHVRLTAGALVWDVPAIAPCAYADIDIAIYCANGDVALKNGLAATDGETLLRRSAEEKSIALTSRRGAELMISVISH